MIKKYQILGLALFAVFAFSALMASSASAVETLAANWLFNGVAVAAALPTKTVGTLLLEDTGTLAGKVAVTCEGILDGTVNAAGVDTTTELLTPGGVKIVELGAEGTGLKCKNQEKCSETAAIEVWPMKLPWGTKAALVEPGGTFEDQLTTSAIYTVLCTALGIAVEDECTAAIGTAGVIQNAATDVELKGAAAPNATCSASGGKATGVIEVVSALIEDTEVGTLAVSE